MKQVFMESPEEALRRLGTDGTNGLTPEQVAESRRLYGSNALTGKKPDSLLKRIWNASCEPMLIMLILAAVIASGVNIARACSGGEANFLECLGIFAAIFLSVVITVVMEGRSAKAFEALNKINEDTKVKVVRGGELQLVPQREIVVGDILSVETGDKLPADGRLLSSVELHADESSLTGRVCLSTRMRESYSSVTIFRWRSGATCFIPARSSPEDTAGCLSQPSATRRNSGRLRVNLLPW